MSDVRLVCFDWGGVLLRIGRTWAEGCAAAGLPVRVGSDDPEAKERRRAVSSRYQVGAIDTPTFLDELGHAVRGAYTADELRRIHDAWLIREYDGIGRLVERLNGVPGVATALLSNTNAAHWARHLPAADGAPPAFPTPGRLTHRHASHLLGVAKPSREIYLALEASTGCRGSEILFFDDLAENIEAARAVGWRAVAIDHTRETSPQIERALEEHGVALA